MSQWPALSRRRAGIVLGFLLVGSFLLRWFGLGFQAPQVIPIDSLVLASEVEVLRHGGDPSYRLHANIYPRFIPYLVLLLPQEKSGKPPPQTLEEHLECARAPYFRVCLVVAFLSVLAVPGTYLLARRFQERGWALLSAALVGTSVLHLWFSQEARPHSGAMSLALFAVLAALRLRRKPVLSSFLLVGVAMGVVIGTLQNGIAVLIPFVAAILLRSRKGVPAPLWPVAVSLLLVAVAGLLLYPSMAGTPHAKGPGSDALIAFNGSTISLMGHFIALRNFTGKGVPIVLGSLCLYDPIIAVAAALGAVTSLATLPKKRPFAGEGDADQLKDLVVVLAYSVPYAIVICLYEFSAQRFVIPLLPYLAVLGASGLRAVWKSCRRRGAWARVAVTGGIVAILSVQTAAAAKLSWIRSQPDTASEAADWIQHHLRPWSDRILVSPGFDLPLLTTPSALEQNALMLINAHQRWFAYQRAALLPADRTSERFNLITLPVSRPEDEQKAIEDPAGFIRALDAGWIVIEVHRTFDWRGVLRLRRALGDVGELVARFSPDRLGTWGEVPIADQGFDPKPFPIFWFLRVLEARSTGMVLEIWKLHK